MLESRGGGKGEEWVDGEDDRGRPRRESVENTSKGKKAVCGEDDRKRPKRFGQVNGSKKE